MKRLLILMCLAVFMTGSAYAAPWKLSHVRPQDTAIDVDLKAFVQEVGKQSENKIDIAIFPASALGDYTVVQERISLGAVQMGCQPVSVASDKRLQLYQLPLLVSNWDQARKNFVTGTPLRNELQKLYNKLDIQILAAWPVYFSGIALRTKPEKYDDATVSNNLKIRVPPIKGFQLAADNLGYMGTPLPFSDTFTAMQTGVVDGIMGSGAEGYYSSFRDLTKFYIPQNIHFEVWYLMVNKELYDGLPDAQKKILSDAALHFEQNRWNHAEEAQKNDEKRLADAGAVILPLSDAAMAQTAEVVHGKVWPILMKDMDEAWAKRVLDQLIK